MPEHLDPTLQGLLGQIPRTWPTGNVGTLNGLAERWATIAKDLRSYNDDLLAELNLLSEYQGDAVETARVRLFGESGSWNGMEDLATSADTKSAELTAAARLVDLQKIMYERILKALAVRLDALRARAGSMAPEQVTADLAELLRNAGKAIDEAEDFIGRCLTGQGVET